MPNLKKIIVIAGIVCAPFAFATISFAQSATSSDVAISSNASLTATANHPVARKSAAEADSRVANRQLPSSSQKKSSKKKANAAAQNDSRKPLTVSVPFEEPEIVVTATRIPTALDKTAADVQVFGQQEIADTQARTVEDALQQLPGVSISTPGTLGQVPTVYVRGVPTDSNQVLLDGRRLPINLAGSYGIENMSLTGIDRIEVAEGPMSAVQGGAAMGGVINLISKDGRSLAKPEYATSFEAGSFNTFDEQASAAGKAGAFDYSANFNRLDTANERPNNHFRLTNFTTRDGYQINRDLYADVLFYYNLADGGQPNATYNFDPTAHFSRETWLISPGVKWKTTDWWTQTLYYSHSQMRQVAANFQPNSYGGFTTDYGQDNRVQVNADQVDYQSVFQIAHNWKVTPGFSLTNNNFWRVINVRNEFNFPATPAGTRDVNGSYTDTAGFLETQYTPISNATGDWNLIGSARVDHTSHFGDYFSYRLGTSYRLKPTQTLFHASYGTAFTPPSPQDIAPALYGNTAIQPETSRGFDIGAEQSFWSDKVKFGGTFFHNDIRNFILYDNATYTLQNIGKVRTDGGEFSLKVQPIKQLGFNVNYTYTDANNLTTSSRLVRVPRHQLSFNIVAKPVEKITVSVGGVWALDRQDFNANGSQVSMPDYFVLRASASWQVTKNMQVFARLENALNADYQQIYGYPSLGRAAYGGVKFTF